MTAALVVAGVSSHVGKTTIVVALAAAFRRRGLRVRTAKCGPDYLDPTYHRLATGEDSPSLDPYLMGDRGIVDTYAAIADGADLVLVEGMMGVFDGPKAESSAGSTADIAKLLGLPILLVVDASGMARTGAAIVHGMATFEPELALDAVLFNRVGSAKHTDLLRTACGPSVPVFGLPKHDGAGFRSRHLGLRTADPSQDAATIASFADHLERHVDLGALLEIARTARAAAKPSASTRPRSVRARIGLADDEALHFLYPDNLARLEAAGAELVRFSPIRDPLPDVDGVYLGGGYPELHAAAISANRGFLDGLASLAPRGAPILAECGGLMVLTNAIVDLEGRRHPMAGLIDAEVAMQPKLVALGYVEVTTKRASLLGPEGTRMRGHQFRYSEIGGFGPGVERLYRMTRNRDGAVSDEGFSSGSVVASYVHVHFASCPEVPSAFVDACVASRPG